MKINTLKQKLLLLLTVAIGGSMLLAGISLSIISKNNLELSTQKSFDSYFERAANLFQQMNTETQFYANELSQRDSVINALNFISEYASIEDYQPLIFDVEKKNIAHTLLDYTKSTQLQEASVYDNRGWLVAFAKPSSSLMAIVSFDNGKPIVLTSNINEGEIWTPLKNSSLGIKVKVNYSKSKSKISYVYNETRVGIEAISDISRQLPNGTNKNIGQLLLTNPINENILNSLSKGSQASHGIILPNGKTFGDEISDLKISSLLLTPNLFSERGNSSRKWLENDRYFIKAYSIPLDNDKHLYLTSSLDKNILSEQINATFLVGFIVFTISALILLPLGLFFARYSITKPIDKLVHAAKSIGEGEYLALDIDETSSTEILALTKALNSAAVTVMTRENELRSSQEILEKHVEERTIDLLATNKKLEHQNKVRLDAEIKLSESTKMLQLIMDSIPQLIFWKDINSTYLGCNQNFIKITGNYNIEDIIGKTDYDMPWSKEEADMYRSDDRVVMYTDTAKYNIHETSKNASGNTIQVETNKVPLHDKDGKVIGILGTYTDITERKNADAILAESEAKFRNIVELSPIGIVLNSMENGNFIEVNPAFLNFTGYTAEEFKTLSYWDLTPKEYSAQEDEQIAMLNATGRYGPYAKEYIHKDGHRFPVLLEGLLVHNLSGEAHIYSMIQDITDRKEFENELVEARDIAEKANMAKSEFLSSMSHELRTPMNAILGFAQLIELDQKDTPDDLILSNIREILDAGHHLLELINEVLDLARIESGELKMKIEEIEVRGIINKCLTLTQPLTKINNVTLIDESEHCEQHFVNADYTRFKQVLINLISNAIKYNHENGKVIIRCNMDESDFLRFDIIDTGIGLTKNEIEKLFTPFERLGAENSGIDGTGIGLVITKQIVEHMKGSIGVDSKKSEGSRFWFSLPCSHSNKNIETDKNKIPWSSSTEITEPTTVKTRNQKILCVDDNAANLRLLEHTFKTQPHISLLCANSADEGIAMARSEKPDLILMDIQMPGKDGNKAFKELQQDKETKLIPVIAISANAMESDINYCLTLGFKRYITKPIDMTLLFKSIREII